MSKRRSSPAVEVPVGRRKMRLSGGRFASVVDMSAPVEDRGRRRPQRGSTLGEPAVMSHGTSPGKRKRRREGEKLIEKQRKNTTRED